jgi:uncharacterized protein (DUF433 family)
MTLPDFLQNDAGEIFLKGHRVCLHHIVQRYNEGASPEALVQQYPTISLALIHKAIAFYLENLTAVDAYVAEVQTEVARQAAMPRRGPTANEMKKRLDALQPALVV